jgi:hypothetical protein
MYKSPNLESLDREFADHPTLKLGGRDASEVACDARSNVAA